MSTEPPTPPGLPLGVVTAFFYRLHPVGSVLAGGLSYPWADVRDVLRFHEEFVTTAPDELSTAVSIGIDPSGQPTVGIALCWCGPHEDGERVLGPLRAFGSPMADTIGSTSYVALQSAADAGFPTGLQHYEKSGWMRTLTGSALDTLIEHVPQMPSSMSGIALQRVHGAASRVAPDATAFPHRADQYDFLIISQWADPRDAERNITWTRSLFDAMQPHLQDAVYVNNLGVEGPARVRSAYGSNDQRLAEVKSGYDPCNITPEDHSPGSRP